MRKKTFLCLIFPVMCLGLLVGWKIFTRSQAKVFRFPIEGYDPRDLLSGHYLRFQVKYPMSEDCGKSSFSPHALCLEPDIRIIDAKAEYKDCMHFIEGYCSANRFYSSSKVDRFYIPEEHAIDLEALIRNPLHKPSVDLFVLPDGSVQIKELLIDEKPWLSWINP